MTEPITQSAADAERYASHLPAGVTLATATPAQAAGAISAGRVAEAARLGRAHGAASATPLGDYRAGGYAEGRDGYLSYVYWDEGSGHLMEAIGVASGEDPDAVPALDAYIESYEATS